MTVVSRTETPGAFRQTITVDAHTLHADVPVASGGGATAPTAHDLFDASLAACKALTALVYARHKGFALDRVTAEVTRDDSQERQGTYGLTVRLAFEGALSAEEKQRVHDVVQRCPVHKLMTTTDVQIRQLPLDA
jgi:putative redox protein